MKGKTIAKAMVVELIDFTRTHIDVIYPINNLDPRRRIFLALLVNIYLLIINLFSLKADNFKRSFII